MKQSTKEAIGALAFGCAIALTILVILYRPTLKIEWQGANQNTMQEVINDKN